jgi:hypothetical protein
MPGALRWPARGRSTRGNYNGARAICEKFHKLGNPLVFLALASLLWTDEKTAYCA